MNIRWVEQKHPNGCCVAALAMVTGHDYDDIAAYFDVDLVEHGLNMPWMEHYLVEHGFGWAKKTKFLPYRHNDHNKQREPWPPAPFGAVHICEVVTSRSHAVVLLADGTVLDPLTPEPRHLADYLDVYFVAAVLRNVRQ